MPNSKNERRVLSQHQQNILLKAVQKNQKNFVEMPIGFVQQTALEMWVALFALHILHDEAKVEYQDDIHALIESIFGSDCFSLQSEFKRFSNVSLQEWFSDISPSGRTVSVDDLGMCYEQSLSQKIIAENESFRWASSSARGRQGAYFTPPVLCDFLVRELIDASLNELNSKELYQLRICDPAMGAGAFLLSALRYIRHLLIELGEEEDCAQLAACIAGADKDANAVLICAISLWLGLESRSISILNSIRKQFVVGDSLMWLSKSWLKQHHDVSSISKEKQALLIHEIMRVKSPDGHNRSSEVNPVFWSEIFPDVFAQGGFSIVLGNPPYLSAMTGGVSKSVKAFYRMRYPLLSGRADLSAYFWNLAVELCKPNGFIGLVLPRPLLGADACRALRAPKSGFFPRLIYSPEHYSFFDDASIKIMCLILGPLGDCRISNGDSPQVGPWHECGSFEVPWNYALNNWWAPFWLTVNMKKWPEIYQHRLAKEGFEVRAGVGPVDYYSLKLVNDPKGTSGPKLVVSGLIDPNKCDWGQRPARYNKRDFLHPCVQPTPEDSSSLTQHIVQSRRPKIILANLVSKLECMLDEEGEYLGATATYCIFDTDNDVERLKWLCQILHQPESTLLFHVALGANAMHSNLSIRSGFLKSFPIPKPPGN